MNTRALFTPFDFLRLYFAYFGETLEVLPFLGILYNDGGVTKLKG